MFAFKRDIRNTGSGHIRVFTALNGIPVSDMKRSSDLDEQIVYVGRSMANYSFSDSGTDKVAITIQISTSASVINNGMTNRKEGDVYGYLTPHYDDKTTFNASWVYKNSGHKNTTRILPKMVPITSMFITDTYRDIFYKLYIDSDDQR